MWARAADYKEVVEKNWTEGLNGHRDLQTVWRNINEMAQKLKQWSSRSFGSIHRKIQKLEKENVIASFLMCHTGVFD